MADEEVVGTLTWPTLRGPGGEELRAARVATLRDGMRFLAALNAEPDAGLSEGDRAKAWLRILETQLVEARAFLIALGFPVEAVDALPMNEVTEHASRFFWATFGGSSVAPTTSPST
jgi:hypothetical protein